jgi:geranylgeranyl diphosphate synthase, type II
MNNSPMFTIEELQNIISNEITKRITGLKSLKPAALYAPVSYSLEEGGKRLRPVLVLMAFNLFSEEIEKALPAAIAVEVFHNFTLLHDDIMDKAEVRRNKPTVHMKYSGNTAILSGDAMAFLSYRYLAECLSDRQSEVIELFTETALEVCEGQQYDMDFEKRIDVSEKEYLEMIRLKTAVLMGCSLKTGALLANAPYETVQHLYEYGINLGMAFQLQDDWLDSFGNRQSFGKMIGGDITAGKKTFLLIKALEKASGEVKISLNKWLETGDYYADEKIKAVIDIYHQLGIKELAEEKIEQYFTKAEEILNMLPVNELRKKQLAKLGKNMLGRSF